MARSAKRRIIKIGVATTDWSGSITDAAGWPALGGAAWVRFGQQRRHMRNHIVIGKLAVVGGRLAVYTHDNQIHTDCHVMVLQRYMDDWVPDAVARAVADGQIVINDVDDWFWGIHPKNQAAKVVDPEHNKTSNLNFYRQTLEASSLVTCSTPFLAERVAEFGPKTHVIRNGVATTMYRERMHKTGRPVIGWTGSTAHRSGDLAVFAKVVPLIGGNARFHHTGAYEKYPAFSKEIGVLSSRVSTLPMLPPEDYPLGLTFDIGIVPLTNIDFNEAKSCIKGLEYAAASIPFVASPLPEYVRLHDEVGVGRLAETPEEWAKHLIELRDADLRTTEARKARMLIRDKGLDAASTARWWDLLFWDLIE